MKDFAGKIVAITGAAHGIGRAIALGFAQQGADLAVFDLDGAALEVTATDLRAFGGRVHTCLLYTSPSPRDRTRSRMPSSA